MAQARNACVDNASVDTGALTTGRNVVALTNYLAFLMGEPAMTFGIRFCRSRPSSLVFRHHGIHVGKSTQYPIPRRVRLCWWQGGCIPFAMPRVRC